MRYHDGNKHARYVCNMYVKFWIFPGIITLKIPSGNDLFCVSKLGFSHFIFSSKNSIFFRILYFSKNPITNLNPLLKFKFNNNSTKAIEEIEIIRIEKKSRVYSWEYQALNGP